MAGVGPLLLPDKSTLVGGPVTQGQTPKKVVVSRVAVEKAGMRATRASAKLEGRVVPAGHRRWAAVAAYLAKQRPQR